MSPPGRVIYANPSLQWSAPDPPCAHRPSFSCESGAIENRFHVTYVFRPRLAEYVLSAIKKGAHVLVEGSLVSSTYDRPNGKGKKAASTKIVSWTIRAEVVRKLDRAELEPETPGPRSGETAEAADAQSF